MERPTMKENLQGYNLEEAHKLYTDCPELYRHIVKLDEYIDYLEDKLNNLVIADFSNCKTEPRLNKLETELDKLQKVHGEIINIYEVHNGCTGFKFKDSAAYRVKLERSFGKVTLD